MNNFGKNIAVWVIISLVLVAIFNVFQGGSSKSQGNVIAYSDFLKRVNSGICLTLKEVITRTGQLVIFLNLMIRS